MSLTQERIDEIAVECWTDYLANASSCTVADTYNHFLSRIREEQEAYGYVSPNDFNINGNKFILDCATDIYNVPLFTIPPAAPCDNDSKQACNCSELLEALTRLSNAVTMQRIVTEQESIALRMANKRAQEALANHAKRKERNDGHI